MSIIALAQLFLGSAGEELEIAHSEFFATGNPCPRASFAKGAEVAYSVSRELVLPANIERGLASTRSFDLPQQVSGHEAHLALVQGDPETGLIQVKSTASSKTRDRRGRGPGQCSTGYRQRPVRGAAI
jgi:CO/xanthine dehydrogenase Mo-binding subunit